MSMLVVLNMQFSICFTLDSGTRFVSISVLFLNLKLNNFISIKGILLHKGT